ncbi:hypothetical protein OGATHE_001361 [Ogataea polymorpha]|uniref:Uncharacterized protein n=1 Tax=Ogataea polymorpha TaxID=460523 RepID=A0A9P8PRE4_9ASCO|nr:hypothetical protein OGATHE_001361 [Ogataea polymorpha]
MMVEESVSMALMEYIREPKPIAVSKNEGFLILMSFSESGAGLGSLVKSAEMTPTIRPVMFQPPVSLFIIGQIGLLVQNANFAMAESVRPRTKVIA